MVGFPLRQVYVGKRRKDTQIYTSQQQNMQGTVVTFSSPPLRSPGTDILSRQHSREKEPWTLNIPPHTRFLSFFLPIPSSSYPCYARNVPYIRPHGVSTAPQPQSP